MAIVVTMSAATACLCLLQAIYILKSGDMRMFFLAKHPGDVSRWVSTAQKIGGALTYGVPAFGIFSVLAYAAVRNGKAAILAWLAPNAGTFFGGVIIFTGGLSFMLWPNWWLKQVLAAYPNTNVDLESRFLIVFTRVLGALILGLALFLLSQRLVGRYDAFGNLPQEYGSGKAPPGGTQTLRRTDHGHGVLATPA